MSSEIDNKLETIIISVISRLYDKESSLGLDYEDLRCLEIISKIRKDANPVDSTTDENRAETDPDLLVELIQKARKFKSKSNVSEP